MIKRLIIALLLPLLVVSCATISQYDQFVYAQTTSVKVDALGLMDMATEDYSAHVADAKHVVSSIDKIYEYERNRKVNEITIKLWDKLRDTTGHLFGGFVARWRREGKLRPAFVDESKKQVGEAFDKIAQLESKKMKAKDAQN